MKLDPNFLLSYIMYHRLSLSFALYCCCTYPIAWSKLADRARWVYSQRDRSDSRNSQNIQQRGQHKKMTSLPLDGPKYRIKDRLILDDAFPTMSSSIEQRDLEWSTKSGGCCTNYQSSSAETLCSL